MPFVGARALAFVFAATFHGGTYVDALRVQRTAAMARVSLICACFCESHVHAQQDVQRVPYPYTGT